MAWKKAWDTFHNKMIAKILPIALLIFVFYLGSVFSSRNLGKKLEKKSQVFRDPVIENYLKAFQSILDLRKLKVFVLNEKQINGLDFLKLFENDL